MRRIAVTVLLLLAPVSAGCSSKSTTAPADGGVDRTGTTTVAMDYAAANDFFAAPFPSEARRKSDGSIDLASFPPNAGNEMAAKVLTLIKRDARGFSRTSGIYFRMSAPLVSGFALSPDESVKDGAAVFVVRVDGDAAGRKRTPVRVEFRPDGGPYGGPNLLGLLPLQGIALEPSALYAAVVRRSVEDPTGHTLLPATAVRDLAKGTKPAGMSDAAFDAHRQALEALDGLGVPSGDIAALTVFRTDDSEGATSKVMDAALARGVPQPGTLALTEVFPTYCVYETTVAMPVYQSGTPPYADTGGGWAFDASGAPVFQRTEQARVLVTVPRKAMGSDGYPFVVFSRTGAGGNRPLVDRGRQTTPGGPAVEPGTGPAVEFARAGFAAISIDGPHGGLRNVTGGDEQFLIFNVQNPEALRDNVRQSAVELALAAHIGAALHWSTDACGGAGPAGGGESRFDGSRVALMGHSMGATFAPIAAAIEPAFGAVVLSGAGGSSIANLLYKLSPVPTYPLVAALLGMNGVPLVELDPMLNMVQWAGEPANPPAYGTRVVRRPPSGARGKNVLMIQGIVDTYILPPMANATSLSLGLSLAGEALDEKELVLAAFTPLRPLLPLSGGTTVPLPVSANTNDASGTKLTAVVVQHAEDDIEDGHEVVFQSEGPKHQYACFLESFAAGGARVPTSGAVGSPCQ